MGESGSKTRGLSFRCMGKTHNKTLKQRSKTDLPRTVEQYFLSALRKALTQAIEYKVTDGHHIYKGVLNSCS